MPKPVDPQNGRQDGSNEAIESINSARGLTMLSLFSGIGGMDLGLEYAGFQSIGCLEIDPHCRSTLRRNRPDWQIIGDGDVNLAAKRLAPSDLNLTAGDLDIISAGPPCQPFSAAAQWSANGRRGMKDERAATIGSMLDIAEKFLPRAILIENVPGFIQGEGCALAEIERRILRINDLHHTGYRVFAKVMNASCYGIPQNRRRAMVVILRDDLTWFWPDSDFLPRTVTAWDALSDIEEAELPSSKGKWADLLPSIPEGWNYQWLTSRGGGEELFGYRTKYWNFLLKLSKSKPSWTLPASPGPSAGPFHWDNRPLTTRERLRLQSFPDSWMIEGSEQVSTKLSGNATPPLLAEVIGIALEGLLKGTVAKKVPSLLRIADIPAPSSVEPIPVSSQYRILIGPKDQHPGSGLGPATHMQQNLSGVGPLNGERRRAMSTTIGE